MAETMEQYMSKTRANYGSGVARPKIEDKDNFELKGQFLKELRTNTFSGSDHEDANEHIEKVLEIVDLFHIPNITIDQVMLRAFPMSLTGAASRWLRNEPTGSITTWDGLKTKFLNKYCPPARTAKKMEEINNFQQEPDENLYQAWERFKELLMKCPQHYLTEMQEVILFYNGLGIPTRQILDSRGAIPSKTAADAKVAIQEMAEYSQKWHNGTSRLRRSYYTKDCPLKEEGKTLKEAYYTQFGGPFQGGGYRAAAPGFYQRNNVNPSYQERRQSMEDTLSKFMSESAKRHEENSNLIKEIRASTDAAIRNQGASIKTLEIQIGQMSKVLQERGFGSLPSSTEANPRDQVKSISTTIKADSYPIRRIGSSQYVVSTRQNRTLMYETRQTTIPFPSRLNGYYCEEKKGSYGPQFSEAYSEASQSIPQKEKDPGSFTLPCFINNVCFNNSLVDLGASVSVIPLLTYLNLGLGELAHTKLTVELADRTVKYPKRIAKNVLVSIGKFVFPIDFIILDMLEDIKVPLNLGRPFLSTAHAKIDVYKRKIT
ncbi:NUDIX hydrolase 6-like protein [Tanacetum coccineum]